MDNKEILFEKTLMTLIPVEDVSIITISDNPSKPSSIKLVRITFAPIVSPLITTISGPIPYTLDKAVPWLYGADVYYHRIKQDLKVKEADTDVRRLFSPEISPPTVRKPVAIPSASTSATVPIHIPIITPFAEPSNTRGKEVIGEPARTEAPKKVIVETSRKEIEEILKIIKKSD